ncbi:MAG: sulfite exporter TauE/SafE family protein [Candidatus Hadarchaeota archaeon]
MLAVLLVGSVGGYLGGVVGAGVGATIVPGLVLLGVDPTVAIGSSLMLHVLISPLGGLYHYKRGNSRKKILVPLALAGMVGAFSGALLSTHIPTKELTILVGVSTIAAGAFIIIKFPRPNGKGNVLKELARKLRGPTASAIALVGLVAGLSHGALGTGWGPLGVPLLMFLGVLPQTAIGSSLLARFFVALVGGSTYFAFTGVQLDVLLPLMFGGSIAVILGAATAKRLRSKTLKKIVGITAIVLGAVVLVKQVTKDVTLPLFVGGLIAVGLLVLTSGVLRSKTQKRVVGATALAASAAVLVMKVIG